MEQRRHSVYRNPAPGQARAAGGEDGAGIALRARGPESENRSRLGTEPPPVLRERPVRDERIDLHVERADRLKELVPAGMTLPEMALRFILSSAQVSTLIPGMRKSSHVDANIAASDAGPLLEELVSELRGHRWERKPAKWSQYIFEIA